jgi:hypothetical protein
VNDNRYFRPLQFFPPASSAAAAPPDDLIEVIGMVIMLLLASTDLVFAPVPSRRAHVHPRRPLVGGA